VDGQPLNWDAYRGQVVLVDFWATWCGPCRAALPELQETFKANEARGLRVVGINLDQDGDALGQFLAENPLPWTHLVGEEASQAAERYGVRGIPTLMLVNREGNVVAVANHLREINAELEKLLAP
jgi:thiol-disulfide isomerase/thioredoxin